MTDAPGVVDVFDQAVVASDGHALVRLRNDRAQLFVVALQIAFFGEIGAVDKDARDVTVELDDRLKIDIEADRRQRAARRVLQLHIDGPGDERLARRCHAIEDADEALGDDLGDRFGDGAADDVAVIDNLAIGLVDEFKDMVFAAQHRDERRRLVEQQQQAFPLGGEHCVSFSGGLRARHHAGAEHSSAAVALGLLELGDVDRQLQDPGDAAVSVEDRGMGRAPVPGCTIVDDVGNQGHVVDDALTDHALKRRAQHLQREVVGVIGIVWKRIKDIAPAQRLEVVDAHHAQICSVGGHEAQIAVENHRRIGRGIEENFEVQQRGHCMAAEVGCSSRISRWSG